MLEAREKRQEEQERHIKELSELNRSLQSGQGLLEGEQSGLRRKVQHFESEITQLNSKNGTPCLTHEPLLFCDEMNFCVNSAICYSLDAA